MKIIPLYLLKNLTVSAACSFILVISILLLISLFITATGHPLNGNAFCHLIIISLTLIPPILAYAFPLITVYIVIFALIQMKEKKQILILKEIGLSESQILMTMIPFTTIIISVHFLLTLYLMPYANRVSLKTNHDIDYEYTLKHGTRENSFQAISSSVTIYFQSRQNHQMKNIFYHNSSGPIVITAKSGRIYHHNLYLCNGLRFNYGNTVNILSFKKAVLNLSALKKQLHIKWRFYERYFNDLLNPSYQERALFYTQAIFMFFAPIFTWNLTISTIICIIKIPECRRNFLTDMLYLILLSILYFILFLIWYCSLQYHFIWYNILFFIFFTNLPFSLIYLWPIIISCV